MKIYFLGTGTSQGIPVIGSDHPVCLSEDIRDKRLRVSVWIQWDHYSFIIDCGPDFRQQMLLSKCPKIDAIFFTHEHADHTAGLDDIRPFFFKQGNIPIYGHQRVLRNLEKRFDYIFQTVNKYPGAPSVDENIVLKEELIKIGDKEIEPINVWHGNLQTFGYRFDRFAYLTDVKSIEQDELKKLLGLDVLVVNALREEPHETHFNLEEALALIEKVKPKRAYLTHISHLFGFHKEIETKLPENVRVAYDNLQITI
ncbi:MBL fold metallo-hydrolase [Flavobacterium oreochromis]|uniref:MBL fold metallo-hydrolase n=2 Tax=Flavobacterium TaxID=237 RepID=A0A246GDE5_9FLAO|nr:MBL fold metallo-hydrolase [Flavobacterium oreochromis]OWP76602.1 MBL fold metallo-hydrolase [Flavobacterium oreochromis]OWP78004.1 MBL fold metallo-hydrolase [Flavobacterium oreochromis]POR18565.1 MBL fold metallo-hydrolase [Flavobacterium columnare]QYS85718.1 MBL fold metallo-hydrolase [Flavobacterium oreochromis]